MENVIKDLNHYEVCGTMVALQTSFYDSSLLFHAIKSLKGPFIEHLSPLK